MLHDITFWLVRTLKLFKEISWLNRERKTGFPRGNCTLPIWAACAKLSGASKVAEDSALILLFLCLHNEKILRSSWPRGSAVDYVALQREAIPIAMEANFPPFHFASRSQHANRSSFRSSNRGQQVKRFLLPADIHVSKCSAASIAALAYATNWATLCAHPRGEPIAPFAECLHDVSTMAFPIEIASKSTLFGEGTHFAQSRKGNLMHSEHDFVSEIFDYLLH